MHMAVPAIVVMRVVMRVTMSVAMIMALIVATITAGWGLVRIQMHRLHFTHLGGFVQLPASAYWTV